MISSILTKTRSINDSKKKGCQRLYECVPQKCTLLFLNNVVSNNDFVIFLFFVFCHFCFFSKRKEKETKTNRETERKARTKEELSLGWRFYLRSSFYLGV